MERASECPYRLTDPEIEHFAQNFDHHDPAFGQDPYPVLRRMQSRSPIVWSNNYGGFWVVTGFDEAHQIYRDYETFATAPSVSVPPGFGHNRPMLPLEVDPPIHGKYRKPLAPLFSPLSIAQLEDRVRVACSRLIDRFIDRNECEFVSELARPLPTEIFVSLLGVPGDEVGDFEEWNFQILHGQHDDPTGMTRDSAGAAARGRLESLLSQRKSEGAHGDDIVSILVRSEIDGRPFTDEEIIDITFLFFLAGLDTVQGEMACQFAFLARNPSHRDLLVEDPMLIPSAIEELLRWEGLTVIGRNVTKAVEVGGALMKAGDKVVIASRAVNRDPRMFDNPDDVDFARSDTRHLTFAVGPHRCIGSHLARLELKVVYEEMHRRIPNYRLRDGFTVTYRTGNVAGVESLPLEWH